MELIILLALLLLLGMIATAYRVSYAVKTHTGVVIALLSGSYLVRLGDGSIVCVCAEKDCFQPLIGDDVEVISAFMKERRAHSDEDFPKDFLIRGGLQTSREDLSCEGVLKNGLLMTKVDTATWLAKDDEDNHVIIDLANDDYKMGDVVKYIPETKRLTRFYFA